MWILHILYERWYLGKTADHVIRRYIGPRRESFGIEPAGSDAGIDAAADVGGQAVADYQRAVRVKTGYLCKAEIKKRLAWLIAAHRLGDKNLLEIL